MDLKLKNSEWLINEVKIENVRQIVKHGEENVTASEWISYLTEEIGELAQAVNDNKFNDTVITKKHVTYEAIQVATLALKIAEMFNFS